MKSYEFLYLFQNEIMALTEIKKTNMPLESTPDQIYSWIIVDKNSSSAHKLTFKSMGEELINGNNINIRTFNEGELRFDQSFAKFVFAERSSLLENSGIQKVDDLIVKAVDSFLSSQS